MNTKNKQIAILITSRNAHFAGWVDPNEVELMRDGACRSIKLHWQQDEGEEAVYPEGIVKSFSSLIEDILDLRDMLEKNIHILEVAEAYNKLDYIIQKRG